MMKRILFLIFMGGFSLSLHAQEKRKIEADKKASYIVYDMKHPMHDWDAKSTQVRSAIAFNTQSNKIEAIAVTASVKSFDSGNSNRDSHAIEVLEALKYPNVSFSSSNLSESGDGEITAVGNLTFHGVSKSIEIKGKKTSSKNNLKIEGKFTINMKEFGVDPPGLMGIKTDEKISISYILVYPL